MADLMQWGHRSHMTAAQRGPPTTGSLKVSTLASHSGRASADGSPGVADGGSCHAHTINSFPTRAAASSHFRDHAVRLRTIGAGVIACADTATDKAKPAIAINLIILHLPKPFNHSEDGPALVFKQRAPSLRIGRSKA